MNNTETTSIEVTLSVAQTLVGAAITTAAALDNDGYHYSAMVIVEQARTLLPALGEYEASYTESLNTLHEIYSKHADDKKDLEPIEAA